MVPTYCQMTAPAVHKKGAKACGTTLQWLLYWECGSLLPSRGSFIEEPWQQILIGILLAVDTQIADGVLARLLRLLIDLLSFDRVFSVLRTGRDWLLELEIQTLRWLREWQRLYEQLLHIRLD